MGQNHLYLRSNWAVPQVSSLSRQLFPICQKIRRSFCSVLDNLRLSDPLLPRPWISFGRNAFVAGFQASSILASCFQRPKKSYFWHFPSTSLGLHLVFFSLHCSQAMGFLTLGSEASISLLNDTSFRRDSWHDGCYAEALVGLPNFLANMYIAYVRQRMSKNPPVPGPSISSFWFDEAISLFSSLTLESETVRIPWLQSIECPRDDSKS